MPRRTNPFQKLSAAIMAVFYEPEYLVEESVLERNPRTGVVREIDIRVTSRVNPEERMIIECRAHKRPQDVQWIDALDGKARSLGFPRAVAVSASGFTTGALIEAHDRGIDALHLRQAEEADWRRWFMAVTELGLSVEGPVLKSVDFGVDADWPGTLPESMDLSQIVLIDTRDDTRIPLLEWVAGLLNDPEQRAQLQALTRSGKLTDLRKTQPCAPEMGFVLRGREEFIPLVELTVHVDYVVSHDKIPLEHLDLGGERILVGESPVRGVPTRVVMHEKVAELRVLIEQQLPDSYD
jgi:hypothetical protein